MKRSEDGGRDEILRRPCGFHISPWRMFGLARQPGKATEESSGMKLSMKAGVSHEPSRTSGCDVGTSTGAQRRHLFSGMEGSVSGLEVPKALWRRLHLHWFQTGVKSEGVPSQTSRVAAPWR